MDIEQNYTTENQIDFTKTGALKFNFQTLKNTASEELANGGLPKNRPVPHHKFFLWAKQLLEDSTNQKVDMSPIYITPAHTKRVMWNGEKGAPVDVNHVLVKRAVVLLKSDIVSDVAGESISPTVAISYNESGIQIAFGENVYACSNMNIWGDNHLQTYGENKVSFESLESNVSDYMKNTVSRHQYNVGIITRLSEFEMDVKMQRNLQAELWERAVEFGGKRGDVLNITQNTRMVEEVIKRRIAAGNSFTAWDFTQAGTENLKPTRNDLVSLYPTIRNFNNFVSEKVLN